MDKSFDLISFGEIMLRLSSPGGERIYRGESFEKRAGGSELNVVSGVSLMGLRTAIISKLPNNDMGTFIKNRIRFGGVSDDYLIYDSSQSARLGLYYYESGAAPRKPSIVYDRKNSSITSFSVGELDERIYSDTKCFHTSGITAALSDKTREAMVYMIKRFKAEGATVSFDVNYRANLWDEPTARKTIESVLPFIDILFCSEETSRRMFAKTGELKDIMKSYCDDYGTKLVATTQRQVISPKQHNFGSVIYSSAEDRYYTEKPYENIDVVDRIGSGDAYVSGVLFGILKYNDPYKALQFGNAAGSIKNTIAGDLPSSDYRELAALIADHNNTGIKSELNR